MSAYYMFVVVHGERPMWNRNYLFVRGDNEAAVHWVRRCQREGKDPRSGTLMRLIGAIELKAGCHFDSLHVPAVSNDVADGLLR